jgi:hypothetical protein
MPIERFVSKEAERRNLAYRHMHGIPYTATTAIVAGRAHKVKHSRNAKRRKIDARQRRKVAHQRGSRR